MFAPLFFLSPFNGSLPKKGPAITAPAFFLSWKAAAVPTANQALKYTHFFFSSPFSVFFFIFARRVGRPSQLDTVDNGRDI